MHKYHRSCSRLLWPFWCLLQLFELKYQKTHNSACSVYKHRKNVFVAYLTVLRLITTVLMSLEVRELLTTRVQCTSITKCVRSVFDRFTVFQTAWSEMSKNLITPRIQCTSITSRVLSLFYRFTAYYNCMSWNVRKLITPRVQWTSITNRVLS